ncbi:cytochrome c oxidase subunit II [Rhabdothermincola sp.]|uniref:cytochrome c oxidase subunit II n=1 Tax=Rhabdothermincola sp. TaxID=2820405 RepID=UPI002FE33FAA
MPRRSLFLKVFGTASFTIVAVLYVALIVAVFRNDDKPLTTLAPKGVNAQTIQNLVAPVFGVAGVIFVAVFGAVLYIAWRFRDRDDDTPMPSQVHGNSVLEVGWTALPALILAAIAVFTVITIIKLEQRSDDALAVRVYGQQWWWSYQYDIDGDGSYDGQGDITTANELVIPAGREVSLTISSHDVIHSFWIPALNGKKDAVPGMDSYWKIEADQPGVYMGQCTEFCGLSHANMRMVVRAVEPAQFDDWVANQQRPARSPEPGSLAAAGEAQFGNLCAQCHVVNGKFEKAKETPPPLLSGVAPDLTHLMTRGTFAGSIFNLYYPQQPGAPVPTPGDPTDVSTPGDPGDALFGGTSAYPVNRVTLEAWLRNPPAMKPAAATQQRGMPNLGLSEQQIDELVAYLETLK